MKVKKILAIGLISSIGVLNAQVVEGVGVNLDNGQTPEATLDINGNLIIEHPDRVESSELYSLYRGEGDIVKKGNSKKDRMMYSLQLNISTHKDKNNQWEDYIGSYDTKIPTDKYYVFITSAVLYSKETNAPAFISHNSNWGYDPTEVNSPREVYMTQKGNYWALVADYRGAKPALNGGDSKGFYWKVNLMIINNDFVERTVISRIELKDDTQTGKGENPVKKIDTYEEYVATPGSFTSKGLVGVNTDEPQAELDVNGNVIVRNVYNATEMRDMTPLLWEPESKRVVTMPDGEKPFTFLTGAITTKTASKGAEDWVEDFDTGIPKDKNIVILTDATLTNSRYNEKKNDTDNNYYAYVMGMPHRAVGRAVYNPQEQIELSVSDIDFTRRGPGGTQIKNPQETWRIKADYYGGNPLCGRLDWNRGKKLYTFNDKSEEELCRKSYAWDFSLMAISTGVASDLGSFDDSMTSAWQGAPNGIEGDDFVKYLLKKFED